MSEQWNDGESDAEYCERLFGENFEGLIPDDYVPTQSHKIFYLLWTPLTQHLKVGKADDEKNLLLRLQERRRQCGDTIILGFKYCVNPNSEEAWWKGKLNHHKIAREVFDLSSYDHDLSFLSELITERGLIRNLEDLPEDHPYFGIAFNPIDLESVVKEYLDWDGDEDSLPLLDSIA
jgi:hypothetical protein